MKKCYFQCLSLNKTLEMKSFLSQNINALSTS